MQDRTRLKDQDVVVVGQTRNLAKGMGIRIQVAHCQFETNLIGSPVDQGRPGTLRSVQSQARHSEAGGAGRSNIAASVEARPGCRRGCKSGRIASGRSQKNGRERKFHGNADEST